MRYFFLSIEKLSSESSVNENSDIKKIIVSLQINLIQRLCTKFRIVLKTLLTSFLLVLQPGFVVK